MAHLTRQEILERLKLRQEEVEVPGGYHVLIQELTALQRLKYIEFLELGDDNKSKMAPEKATKHNKMIASLGCINDDGTPMWASADDVPDLRDDAFEKINRAILKLAGIPMVDEVVTVNPPNESETPTAPSN
jgi:hypothetical protein